MGAEQILGLMRVEAPEYWQSDTLCLLADFRSHHPVRIFPMTWAHALCTPSASACHKNHALLPTLTKCSLCMCQCAYVHAQVREGKLATSEGVSYLEVKHMLLLQYCQHLLFYLLLRAGAATLALHHSWKDALQRKRLAELQPPWLQNHDPLSMSVPDSRLISQRFAYLRSRSCLQYYYTKKCLWPCS